MTISKKDDRLTRTQLRLKIKYLKDQRTPACDEYSAGTWDAFKAYSGISRETLRGGSGAEFAADIRLSSDRSQLVMMTEGGRIGIFSAKSGVRMAATSSTMS